MSIYYISGAQAGTDVAVDTLDKIGHGRVILCDATMFEYSHGLSTCSQVIQHQSSRSIATKNSASVIEIPYLFVLGKCFPVSGTSKICDCVFKVVPYATICSVICVASGVGYLAVRPCVVDVHVLVVQRTPCRQRAAVHGLGVLRGFIHVTHVNSYCGCVSGTMLVSCCYR